MQQTPNFEPSRHLLCLSVELVRPLRLIDSFEERLQHDIAFAMFHRIFQEDLPIHAVQQEELFDLFRDFWTAVVYVVFVIVKIYGVDESNELFRFFFVPFRFSQWRWLRRNRLRLWLWQLLLQLLAETRYELSRISGLDISM